MVLYISEHEVRHNHTQHDLHFITFVQAYDHFIRICSRLYLYNTNNSREVEQHSATLFQHSMTT